MSIPSTRLRCEVSPGDELGHLLVRRAQFVSLDHVEQQREDRHVAGVSMRTPGRPSILCAARSMSSWSRSGSYQVDAVAVRPSQRRA
jgi:hypothetical protein